MSVGARILTACIATLAAARGAGAADIAALDQSWKWVSNQHFELLTNGSERKARAALGQLEAFRAAMSVLNQGRLVESPRPIRVAIFERPWQMAPYLPGSLRPHAELVGGYFATRGETHYLAMNGDWGDELPRNILRGYAYVLIARQLGGLPPWMSVGLADFFAAFRYIPRNHEAQIGRGIAEYMQLLNSSPPYPLTAILDVRPDQLSTLDETTRRLFDAKSWLLVHYLRAGSLDRAGALARYLRNREGGLPAQDALAIAAGCSLEKLEAELTAYQRKSLVGFLNFGLGDPLESTVVRSEPATPEDAIYRLGEHLLALGPEASEAATAHFAASGRPAPAAEPAANAAPSTIPAPMVIEPPAAASARIVTAADDIAPLRAAIDAGNASREQKLLFARVANELAAHDWESARRHFTAARAALREVLVGPPADAEASPLLTWFYQAEPSPADLPEGLAAYQTALASLPDDDRLRLDLARLQVRAGDEAAARSTAEAVAAEGRNSQILTAAEVLLVDLDVREAQRLRAAGRADEGTALLAARFARTRGTAGREAASRSLEAFHLDLANDAIESRYRAAVALVNAQFVVDGAEALRRFIRDYPDSAWAELARQDLDRVEAYLARRRSKDLPTVPPPAKPPPPGA